MGHLDRVGRRDDRRVRVHGLLFHLFHHVRRGHHACVHVRGHGGGGGDEDLGYLLVHWESVSESESHGGDRGETSSVLVIRSESQSGIVSETANDFGSVDRVSVSEAGENAVYRGGGDLVAGHGRLDHGQVEVGQVVEDQMEEGPIETREVALA